MKAREIIPGWPRGRSTTSGGKSFAREFMEWPHYFEFGIALDSLNEPRFHEDIAAERAEEARKAKMMQQYYDSQMRDVMGVFVNDITCPWNPDWPEFLRYMGRTREQRMKAEAEFWYSKRS